MTPSERLWAEHEADVDACLEHPFVQGIASGDLDLEAFRIYVAQDAFFLHAFFGAYGIAAARCEDDLERATMFHGLMGGVLEEMKLHRGYARELGIDLEHVDPLPATSAYTDFLSSVAWSRPLPEIVAAMVPCMRLYAHLGAELAARGERPDDPFGRWIDTYADPGFRRLARTLEAVLDEVCGREPDAGVRRAYARAMQCERGFFSAPLEAAGNPVP